MTIDYRPGKAFCTRLEPKSPFDGEKVFSGLSNQSVMHRRDCLTGVGTGAFALLAGCSGLVSDSDTPTHLVQVANGRETAHEVFVEVVFEGKGTEYGPRTIAPGDNWEVTRFDSEGELTVRVEVDDERIWDDTHRIPTLSGDRRSFAQVELLPDGEVRAGVVQEE